MFWYLLIWLIGGYLTPSCIIIIHLKCCVAIYHPDLLKTFNWHLFFSVLSHKAKVHRNTCYSIDMQEGLSSVFHEHIPNLLVPYWQSRRGLQVCTLSVCPANKFSTFFFCAWRYFVYCLLMTSYNQVQILFRFDNFVQSYGPWN